MTRRSLLALAALPLAAADDAVAPKEKIQLFDGKSLNAFDTWLVDHHHTDPNRVFTVVDQVDGAAAIRVSGENWGGILTKHSYRDYKLTTEFRWGLATWGNRKSRARDSGILLHCQGRPGNYQKDFNGPWMRSVEFQIIEGGTGDILLVGGYEQNGELLRPTLTTNAKKDRDGETVYDQSSPAGTFSTGRINWWGRDVDWTDTLGFRGKEDVESPLGQWNHLEAIVDGDKLTYFVNGKQVNGGTGSSLTSGKLLFQSEGAEIYFRRIELEPVR